ncbi:hypothetical protein TSAR_000456 [Trichomalopsis sarcophagae]|uniref:SCP domain-containing protein n=1 Tax=Trichomalopsis sarcophagae TaxID=543379 RepID=A0A232F6I0_9HYME|nr:hypothetical protein TSAR_000456 [Trichomalopsis sarcophagae]
MLEQLKHELNPSSVPKAENSSNGASGGQQQPRGRKRAREPKMAEAYAERREGENLKKCHLHTESEVLLTSQQCCINISNNKAKMNQALLVVLSLFVVNEHQPVAGWTWGKSATSSSSSNNSINDDRARYCRICASHTMCLFPYDDPGPKCAAVENGDLEPEEIEWILQRHNSLRDGIARAWKSQYRPLPARDMMQVLWDNELAKIARRWALQCNIHEKDQCRDRFSVAQSVSALDLQDAANRSEMERLKFHLRSWYSQLEPDFSNSAGVGLATPSVTNVGCGRATYSVAIDDSDVAAAVEVLVCNYGPIDDPETESDFGCETRSRRYSELCLAGGIFAKRRRRRRASSPDAHRRRGVAPLADCGKRRRCYYQLSSTVSGAATAAAAALMCLRDAFFFLYAALHFSIIFSPGENKRRLVMRVVGYYGAFRTIDFIELVVEELLHVFGPQKVEMIELLVLDSVDRHEVWQCFRQSQGVLKFTKSFELTNSHIKRCIIR